MGLSPPEIDLAAADFAEVLGQALARGAHLLTRGECVVVERMRALPESALALYARLTLRVGTVWAADTLPAESVGTLVEAGLLSPLVTWSQRAEASTVSELKDGCRRLGLRLGGRRDALIERLAGHRRWTERRFVRLVHPALVRRLEQWAWLRRNPDRSAAVVQRLGILRWPDYPLTPGVRLFRTRSAFRRWDDRSRSMDAVPPETWLAWLADPVPAPGRLALHGGLVRRVRHAARELERAGEPHSAVALYEALVTGGHVAQDSVVCRWALALEAAGRQSEALRRLRDARGDADGGAALAIGRTGRRMARRCRAGWPPDRPLRTAPERTLRLVHHADADASRPLWGSGDPAVIERAVMQLLHGHGRRVVRGEAPLWRSLVALLMTPVLFEPVAGQLPVPYLSAPLDWRTPAFTDRRRAGVEAILAAVRAGEGADRVARACAQWRGTRVAGVRWTYTDDELVDVAAALDGVALAQLCRHWLEGRRGVGRGLPDLLVLPGPSVRLDAFPSRLSESLVAVEVKGPSDALRDEQVVWLDRLLGWGVRAEVWQVRPG